MPKFPTLFWYCRLMMFWAYIMVLAGLFSIQQVYLISAFSVVQRLSYLKFELPIFFLLSFRFSCLSLNRPKYFQEWRRSKRLWRTTQLKPHQMTGVVSCNRCYYYYFIFFVFLCYLSLCNQLVCCARPIIWLHVFFLGRDVCLQRESTAVCKEGWRDWGPCSLGWYLWYLLQSSYCMRKGEGTGYLTPWRMPRIHLLQLDYQLELFVWIDYFISYQYLRSLRRVFNCSAYFT